jgi:hypothetical protein
VTVVNDAERLADLECRVLALENRLGMPPLAPTPVGSVVDMSIFARIEHDLDRIERNIAQRRRIAAEREAREDRTG